MEPNNRAELLLVKAVLEYYKHSKRVPFEIRQAVEVYIGDILTVSDMEKYVNDLITRSFE